MAKELTRGVLGGNPIQNFSETLSAFCVVAEELLEKEALNLLENPAFKGRRWVNIYLSDVRNGMNIEGIDRKLPMGLIDVFMGFLWDLKTVSEVKFFESAKGAYVQVHFYSVEAFLNGPS